MKLLLRRTTQWGFLDNAEVMVITQQIAEPIEKAGGRFEQLWSDAAK